MGEAAEGRCFTIFFCIYKPGVKIADFHPAIAGSISASHFAARPRKTTPGPGASKTSPGRQKCCKTPNNNQTPLSLSLSGAPQHLAALGARRPPPLG